MKITKTQLKQIIKEELDKTLFEAGLGSMLRRGAAALGHDRSQDAIAVAQAAMRIGGSIGHAAEKVADDLNIRSDEDMPPLRQVVGSIKNLDKIQKDVNFLRETIDRYEQEGGIDIAFPEELYTIAMQIVETWDQLTRHLKTGEGSPYEIWSFLHDLGIKAEDFLRGGDYAGAHKDDAVSRRGGGTGGFGRPAYTESRKRRSTKRRRR